MLSGWMGVSPELRVEVMFLMTFSSVNPVKIGDGWKYSKVHLNSVAIDCRAQILGGGCHTLHP